MLERETIKEWRLKIDHEEEKLEFKDKKVRLSTIKGENLMVILQLVGKCEGKDAIYLVEK